MRLRGIYNLRLVSSESIIAALYIEDDEWFLGNPMEVTFYTKPGGSSMISLSPWLPFGDKETKHQIYEDGVIAISECGQEMVDYYNDIVIKYRNGFVNKPETQEEEINSVEELEESLDILEALSEKAKGKLH
jgi:hypothetical protein